MQIAIVQFPGSNCERETRLAIERAGMQAIDFLWNEPVDRLTSCDGFVIIGGFSYEDRSRAGVIAAQDPVMKVIAEQSSLGKPVLGICNGAQILVETGLVPGLPDNAAVMALTTNKRVHYDKVVGTGFYNCWSHLRLHEKAHTCAFTHGISKNTTLHVPIAHAEGRFVMEEELLAKIRQLGLAVFQYCDEEGTVSDEFPINPNGSVDNLAAVSNLAGNVLAIMPHPERTPNGDAIFSSMHDYIAEQEPLRKVAMNYQAEKFELTPFQSDNHELLVDYVITDNHALTVQNAFAQFGLPLAVKRYQHWSVESSPEALEAIKTSDELFNPSKEFLVSKESVTNVDNSICLLVREKEDFLGQQKFQLLANHFEIDGIRSIYYGVIWQLTTTDGSAINDHLDAVLQSRLLSNPVSQRCFTY